MSTWSLTALRTVGRKMSRSTEDDDSLLVHDPAASQRTQAPRHTPHILLVTDSGLQHYKECEPGTVFHFANYNGGIAEIRTCRDTE
jgi:hypothetical protein